MQTAEQLRAAHLTACDTCRNDKRPFCHLRCLADAGDTIIIGFDMDNVLTMFEAAFRSDWNALFPRLAVDIEDPQYWGLERDVLATYSVALIIEVLEEEYGKGFVTSRTVYPDDPEKHIRDALRVPIMKILGRSGFYRHLEPIRANIEELKHIASLTRPDGTPRYIVPIVTTAPREYGGPRAEKINWLRQELGGDLYNQVIPITTPDKTLVVLHLIFDDKHHIKGALEPLFEHVVVDMPYNREGAAADKYRVFEGERWTEKLGL